ncbi:RsmB/NOP family class I SAM-dependent RNA methyltransferase [Sphingomonas sp. IC-11]|uniref:RsmB/NOP family class I SAM-dependent RNA methyltransferase n=1 Tax=Sphingomonas sp. IC-11 TaxID=2898528 RepID=UPI001E5F8F78|nr:RsmB/NOP family class I SAM-dependent RNA methyltransferase [Sphingomonas sp. IC-11]MCD2315806.1 RsmB/NOP family class I SAM-dependent RNA methyltransferase [Sphingomonas sp. IC-11]
MTPAARTQAAIELLDAIIAAAREGGAAADTLIARYFASRRYAGSKDRRAIRELVYTAVRQCGEPPSSGRGAMLLVAQSDPELASRFDGSQHGPAAIEPGEPVAERGVVPAWIARELERSGIQSASWPALVERAPLDVRARRDVDARELLSAFPDAQPIAHLERGWRLPAGSDVASLAGAVEVQDAGSQAVSLAAQVGPGMTVIDLCAGAGGKTLALGDTMEDRGRIVACDVDRGRLSRLAPRAERANLTIVESRLLDPGREAQRLGDLQAGADLVFVDAPCSGTGTWRRNPEARWRLTPERLSRFVAMQAHVLEVAAPLVKPGGAIVYVVCSLLDAEGKDQVDNFLSAHAGWTAADPTLPIGAAHGRGVRLSPAQDQSDGFFVARLVAPC